MSDVPLRDYVDMKVCALERTIDARLREMDRAVDLNAETLNERLKHSNGLIEQMREQARDYTRKSETHALTERLNRLEKMSNVRTGQSAGMQPLVAIGMMVLSGLIAGVVAVIAVKVNS